MCASLTCWFASRGARSNQRLHLTGAVVSKGSRPVADLYIHRPRVKRGPLGGEAIAVAQDVLEERA
jgi:hypothetical protein